MGITIIITGATLLVAKYIVPGFEEIALIGVGVVVLLVSRK